MDVGYRKSPSPSCPIDNSSPILYDRTTNNNADLSNHASRTISKLLLISVAMRKLRRTSQLIDRHVSHNIDINIDCLLRLATTTTSSCSNSSSVGAACKTKNSIHEW